MDRRTFMHAGLAAPALAAIAAPAAAHGSGPSRNAVARPDDARPRLRQSVCAWCFGGMTLDELCVLAKRIGIGAIDLLNEPHGQATWGAGNPSTDWNHFAEAVIPVLGAYVPNSKFLMFVEGIEWGHTFRDYPKAPLSVPDEFQHRVVFSPHTYGKSVVPESSFDANVLFNQWDTDFGFLRTQHSKSVVVGEWGGRTDIDQEWMRILVRYLIQRNMTDNFFWSLGPNSGDVQGFLLDDWTSIDPFKSNILRQI